MTESKLYLTWKTLISFIGIGILGTLFGIALLSYEKWLGTLLISLNSFLVVIACVALAANRVVKKKERCNLN